MSTSGMVQFDRIHYITPDQRGETPLRRSCLTFYERFNDGRSAQAQTFEADPDFLEALAPWLSQLCGAVPSSFGAVYRLTSAGFYADKKGGHGRGEAMDIDEVTWSTVRVRPLDIEHESSDIVRVRRYLGVEAVCRCHFSVVLDGWYDALHRDHLHAEGIGAVPLDRSVRSHAVFCQAVCNALFGAGLDIDGSWGDRTQEAMDEAQRVVGVAGDLSRDVDVWIGWLKGVARTALRGEAFTTVAGDHQ